MITIYPHNANELSARIKKMSRAILTYAIENNLIERPHECESCGKWCVPDGHHTNYFEPLNVVWLCKICHLAQHPTRRHEVSPIPRAKKERLFVRADNPMSPFEYLASLKA
jgi:hypothetical protein